MSEPDMAGIFEQTIRELNAKSIPVDGWRFVLASAVCPDCGQEFTIPPMFGTQWICRGCESLLVVVIGPFRYADDKAPICSLLLLSESGNHCWIFGGSTNTFPPKDRK